MAPSLLRAAGKNYKYITGISSIDDYKINQLNKIIHLQMKILEKMARKFLKHQNMIK